MREKEEKVKKKTGKEIAKDDEGKGKIAEKIRLDNRPKRDSNAAQQGSGDQLLSYAGSDFVRTIHVCMKILRFPLE